MRLLLYFLSFLELRRGVVESRETLVGTGCLSRGSSSQVSDPYDLLKENVLMVTNSETPPVHFNHDSLTRRCGDV